jgi:hypothetical protein
MNPYSKFSVKSVNKMKDFEIKFGGIFINLEWLKWYILTQWKYKSETWSSDVNGLRMGLWVLNDCSNNAINCN